MCGLNWYNVVIYDFLNICSVLVICVVILKKGFLQFASKYNSVNLIILLLFKRYIGICGQTKMFYK